MWNDPGEHPLPPPIRPARRIVYSTPYDPDSAEVLAAKDEAARKAERALDELWRGIFIPLIALAGALLFALIAVGYIR